jgi:paraquat-inducible protein B
MSIRGNPTAIGAFLIGALVLLVAATATLASTAWFDDRSTFISYFAESVNGLENGAPVKFQGVPVGNVTGLGIQIDERDRTFQVPVEYEIDLTRLRTQHGTFVDLNDSAVLDRQIAAGLRAQLQMESIVTGQLYVELSYRTDPAPPELEERRTTWPEIPTAPSLLAALGTGAGSLVADILKVLFQVNEMLADVDMPQINAAVMASAEAVEGLVGAPELRSALEQLPALTAQATRTMEDLGRLAVNTDSAIGPLQLQLQGTATELTATLEAMRRSLEETHGLLSTDSGLGYELHETLTSLREAADALNLLVTSLEQNPDMLLRGRKPPEN